MDDEIEQRQPRESEIILQEIYDLFPGLLISVWYPYPQHAAQMISVIQDKLVRLKSKVLEEANENKEEDSSTN